MGSCSRSPAWRRCGSAPTARRLRPAPPFSAATGILSIYGEDATGDAIVVSATGSGAILVNGGALPIRGDVPTLKNTLRIEIDGRGGDDVLELDEPDHALPPALLRGGAGDDVLRGGSSADVLEPGPGSDTVDGGPGDDEIRWRSGDGVDQLDGGRDRDALVVTGSEGADDLSVLIVGATWVVREGGRKDGVRADGFERLTVDTRGGDDHVAFADFGGLRMGLVVHTGAGHDVLDASGLGPDVWLEEAYGGEGDDAIYGGLSSDFLIGGPGADLLVADGEEERTDGLGGHDLVWAGDGDDVVYGGPGDDTLFGEEGDDVLYGQEDDDWLDGGAGFDRLDGGSGFDEEINGEA